MRPRAGAQARMFVRQLSNDLYLAPAALAQGRYVIEGTPEALAIDAALASAAARVPGRPGRPRKGSARDRLTVVDPVEDDEPDDDTTAGGRPETDSSGEVPPF